MSDGTPTIGELERRIADLEAHVEELDERAGLADEPQEYADNTPSFVDEAVNEITHNHEQESRRRSTGGPR